MKRLALLIFLLTASNAHAFEADFQHDPAAPEPGEVVTLTASTDSETPVRLSWDLDADGAFDDATGDSTQTSFATAGAHLVRLRAERVTTAGTEEKIVEKSIPVGSEPAPTPTATATATASPSPAANQPPVAKYDRKCAKQGTVVYCAGLVARESALVNLDARPSTDPDGSIVRYEWDLDGDGKFDREGGPVVNHTFNRLETLADPLKRQVTLRVTDDDGAMATDTFVISLIEQACRQMAVYKYLRVEGGCIKHRNVKVNGVAAKRFEIHGPATLNGVTVVPGAGPMTLDVPRSKNKLAAMRPHFYGRDVKVLMSAGDALVEVYDGNVNWEVRDGDMYGFKRSPTMRLNGLAVTGNTRLQLGDGTAAYDLYVKLPEEFGSPTSDKPLRLGSLGAATASGEPLSFGVSGADLGPVGLVGLKVTYDGVDVWRIDASAQLPAPADVKVDADASFNTDGDFLSGGGALDFGAGIEIGGPVPIFLKSISFRVNLAPVENECTPYIGVKENKSFLAFLGLEPKTIDYGIPEFALCGGIRLTGGPTIPIIDEAAIAVDGKLGFATFTDRPWNFRAKGEMEVAGIPMADAGIYVSGSGYTLAYGEYSWGLEDVFHIGGYGRFEFKKTKFNAQAGGEACIDVFSLCRGFDGIISSKGIAVCLSIDVVVDDWEPGLGYEWGDAFITPYFAGCDVGDYKVHISDTRAAAMLSGAQTRTITLPAGLPGAVIAATGTSTPPEFTLVGPNGERIDTAGEGPWIERPGVVIAKDARRNITQVAFSKPAGGAWRVESESAIVDLRSANGLEEPQVEARVSGRGQQRVLHYDTDQEVTFVERSATAGQELGTVTGSGRLRFTPAAGAAEKRSIVALVEGREQVPVTRYDAPAARKPGTPERLRAKRAGRSLKVSWKGRAASYKVAATLKDGRRLLKSTGGNRVRFSGVRVRGRVTVEPLSAAGMTGRTAKARIR